MIYKHLKGEHSSKPFTPKAWVRRLEGSFYFTKKSFYDFGPGDIDQLDWNKLIGISFNPIKPNQNAIMIGWRYDTNLKCFQIAPYFNGSGQILNPDVLFENKILDLWPNEIVTFYIDFWGINYKLSNIDWIRTEVPKAVKTNKFTNFMVQPWFGGNRTAPNDIELNVDIY